VALPIGPRLRYAPQIVTAGIALVIVAKEPAAGQSKTRLASVLSVAQRTALAEAMLLDKIAQVDAVLGVRPWLAYAPDEALSAMRARCDERWGLLAQGEGPLGARLTRVSEALFRAGYSAVILIGSDSPTLPRERLDEARDALASGADAVIGPAEDGGYYLLGLRAFEPSVFEAIEWSTERVFAQTTAAIERAGLRWTSLAESYDVDVASDLLRLARELAGPNVALAPRTAAALATMRLAQT
jgi:rSAM/selenodomain-associated transferase 1